MATFSEPVGGGLVLAGQACVFLGDIDWLAEPTYLVVRHYLSRLGVT
jgi:hypothetical protein